MQPSEKKIIKKYQNNGYTIIEQGFPDFTAIKICDNKITDLKFIEVKTYKNNRMTKDALRMNQVFIGFILKNFGFEYIVEYIDEIKNISISRQFPLENKRLNLKWIIDKYKKYPKGKHVLDLNKNMIYDNYYIDNDNNKTLRSGWLPLDLNIQSSKHYICCDNCENPMVFASSMNDYKYIYSCKKCNVEKILYNKENELVNFV